MAVKFQGGKVIGVAGFQEEALKTDLRESARLLQQVYERMRNAYVEANSAGINQTALNNLKGLGEDIRRVTTKLDATYKAIG